MSAALAIAPEARARADARPESWLDVCALDDLVPGTGACALVAGRQVALFRPGAGPEVYALDNFDPFSKAFVLSRGILGDRGGTPKVASPMYKQSFDLRTGACLDDGAVRVATFAVRVSGGRVEVCADPAGGCAPPAAVG